jgi:hypothetical protein
VPAHFRRFQKQSSTAAMLSSLGTAVAIATCVQAVHWDRARQYCGHVLTWYRETTRVCTWNMSITTARTATFWSLFNASLWFQSFMTKTCLISGSGVSV